MIRKIVFLVMYAADTVLFATNKKDLQKSLNIYSKYCSKWKLDINIEKTKVLCFGRKRHCQFFINNKQINIVDDFKYLGVVFTKIWATDKCNKRKVIQNYYIIIK